MPRDEGTKTFGQVTVGTSAVLLLAANGGRESALLANASGSITVVLGKDANVVASAPSGAQYLGVPLLPGQSLDDPLSTDAWWGICASGSADIRTMEVS